MALSISIKFMLFITIFLVICKEQQVFGLSLPLNESCHLREFDLCMASGILITQVQPQDFKIDESSIEKQCKLFRESEECLDSFRERCMTSLQSSLIDFLNGGILKYMRDYCTKGSELREMYLKHGNCILKERKNTNKCVLDYQVAIEISTSNGTDWKQRPKVVCCAMNRLKECNDKILGSSCGKEAVEVGNTVAKGTFSRASIISCDKYDPKSLECQTLLPPVNTVPRGNKSNSIISKLISAITQT